MAHHHSEEWRRVLGSFGWYEVSNLGRVRSPKGVRKPSLDRYGYLYVHLRARGISKNVKIHRLVAESFIGPSNGLQINHKDGNKQNNAIDNLEWVTNQQNHVHRALVLKKVVGESHGRAKITAEMAANIYKCPSVERSRRYKNNDTPIEAMCKKYGISRSVAGKIRCRSIWKEATSGLVRG